MQISVSRGRANALAVRLCSVVRLGSIVRCAVPELRHSFSSSTSSSLAPKYSQLERFPKATLRSNLRKIISQTPVAAKSGPISVDEAER